MCCLCGGAMSRRKLIGTAAAGTALGMARPALGHDAHVHDAHVHDDHAARQGVTASRALRAQSANIPTPREQTVVINQGTNEVYDSFNPYVPNGEQAAWGMHQIAREPFFVNNLITGEMIPWLATGYTYSPDFMTLTLTLQPAATWSDGQPFTADDIVFTFDMLKANTELYGSSDAQACASVIAQDPQTVVFTFLEAQPRFHLNFDTGSYSQWIRIVPKHIWEGQDPNTFKFNPPVYTGPYTLSQANPQTLMYVWQKNPTYWNTAVSFAPEYVIWTQDLPLDATVQEFQRGALDVSASIDYLNQQAIMGEYDKTAVCDYPDPCPRALLPNNLSPLFQHPEARQALSLLVDRDLIGTTIMQPPTEAAEYPWANYASNDLYNLPDVEAQYGMARYDPERASQLLDSIGVTKTGDWRTLNGQELKVSIITPSAAGTAEFQIGQLVAQEAQKIGLNAELVNLQGATYTDALQTGNYDVQSGWMCDGAPPTIYDAYAVTGTDDPVVPIGTKTEDNVERIDIPAFAPLVEQLATLPADAVDNPVFAQALDLFYQQMPKVPTVQTKYSFLQNTAYWTGWPTNEDAFGAPKTDLAAYIVTLSRLKPVGGA